MANPQKENGYTKINHANLEALLRWDGPGRVKDFVLAVWRETWGWETKMKRVTLARFGELLGVSRQRAMALRDQAIEANMIIYEDGIYGPQKDYEKWGNVATASMPDDVNSVIDNVNGAIDTADVNSTVDNDVNSTVDKSVNGTVDTTTKKGKKEKETPQTPQQQDGALFDNSEILDGMTASDAAASVGLPEHINIRGRNEKAAYQLGQWLADGDTVTVEAVLRYIEAAADVNSSGRIAATRCWSIAQEAEQRGEEFRATPQEIADAIDIAIERGKVHNKSGEYWVGILRNRYKERETAAGADDSPPDARDAARQSNPNELWDYLVEQEQQEADDEAG